MSKKPKPPAHTGKTGKGHTRDVTVDRIGNVTIFKRGPTYYLYYREDGRTKRPKIDGNLSVARATADKVAAALEEDRPSPVSFQRTSPAELVDQYLDYAETVQCLAWRTLDRYRAAKIRLAVGQSQRVHAAWLIQQPEYWDGLIELRNRPCGPDAVDDGRPSCRIPRHCAGHFDELEQCEVRSVFAARSNCPLPPRAVGQVAHQRLLPGQDYFRQYRSLTE